MFQIGIGKRNYDFGIDYDLLAERTENYVSADISLVIDTATRPAFRRKKDSIASKYGDMGVKFPFRKACDSKKQSSLRFFS